MPSEQLEAQLDRVAVTLKTAGYADGVLVTNFGSRLVIQGPPRSPRKHWTGSEQVALRLLTGLADDAGPDAFWNVFDGAFS